MAPNHKTLAVRFATMIASLVEHGEVDQNSVPGAVESLVYAISPVDGSTVAGYETDLIASRGQIANRINDMVDAARGQLNQTGRVDRIALEQLWDEVFLRG